MQIARLAAFAAFALGIAAAPTEKESLPYAVSFDMWNGDCGATRAHTWGSRYTSRQNTDLCFPLAEDTHALSVFTIDEGCRVTAYRSPLCDDYPDNGAYAEKEGCLWSNTIYKSYKLTCHGPRDDLASLTEPSQLGGYSSDHYTDSGEVLVLLLLLLWLQMSLPEEEVPNNGILGPTARRREERVLRMGREELRG
ncbi:hypothetical protein NUW58_g1361 [Xylaria curta]|uniref:Uncharacterized protein n=1 Tax=Xylaria curta TaxID=42375 RepID=A0ACC1PKG7_9PEZI|nr:hypothetical protein NUW58_g1361 [Xylaria curta]